MVGLFAMLPRRRNTLMICTVADLAQSISIGDSLEMKCVLLGLSRGRQTVPLLADISVAHSEVYRCHCL